MRATVYDSVMALARIVRTVRRYRADVLVAGDLVRSSGSVGAWPWQTGDHRAGLGDEQRE